MKNFLNLKLFQKEKLFTLAKNLNLIPKFTKRVLPNKIEYTLRPIPSEDSINFKRNSSHMYLKKGLIQINYKSFSSINQPNLPMVKKEKETKANYKDIKNVILPLFKTKIVKRLLIYSLILTIGSKLLITTSPYFLKLAINSIIEKEKIKYGFFFIALFGLNRIIGSNLYEYRQVILNKLTSHVIIDFSQKMMEYLMKIDHHQFKHNSQHVLSKFEKSLRGIESINRFLIGSLLSNTIEFGIVSVMLFVCCGPKYFLNTVAIYTFYMITTNIISKKRRKEINERWKEELKAESKLSDTIYNIDTVKYFQKEDQEIKNYTEICKSVRVKAQNIQVSLAKLNISQSFIISTGMISNLSMGVIDCYHGLLTAGDIVMLNVIFNQVMTPLNFLGSLMREVDETRINLSFTIEMINKRESLLQEKNLPLFEYRGGNIEFNDISYGYSQVDSEDPIKMILNKMNVTFERGTTNAIVGHSGNGKTTIFNLLYKLVDPTSGKIQVDGQNLNELNIESYRNYLSICPQNGYLFNTSIYNNIAYGKKNATVDEVVEIAKAVNMHNIIEKFPEKYNSNVGTLGAKLSGGEKQRLLLARSFIKDSHILLLDEPTSNLDNENEKLIMDYIFSNYKNKTVLVCAHKYKRIIFRLNTIINCDKIYVLNNGVICESGNHKELISNPSNIYHELYKKTNKFYI